MIETDAGGFPIEVDDLDADWLLDVAEQAETQTRIAERRKLRLAHHWCILHPGITDPSRMDVDDTIGADGTPTVTTFAAEPLAAALQLSPSACRQLLRDTLDLTHRLPRTWAHVEALTVPAWRARRLAQATHTLTARAAAYVDHHLADRISTCGAITIDRLVGEAAARHDPAAHAAREAKAQRSWGVTLNHSRNAAGYDATSWLDATGDTLDLTRFHDLVCETAADLATNGDTSPLDIRKARALGVIADHAFGPRHPSTPTDTPTGDTADATAGDTAARDTQGPRPTPPRSAKTRLYLHLNAHDLADTTGTTGTAIGTAEKLGPVTMATIRAWLSNSHATIVPVLDLARTDPTDTHDPPAWMRELVILRDQHCVFPWCTHDARSCDLDHIDPYLDPDHGGPPGQTRPDNLAPLCRRHHRAKTKGLWRYRRTGEATYTWTSPHHRAYLVTPTGSTRIG